MKFTLYVWRQASPKDEGVFKKYELEDISADSSFLEMLDFLNERLVSQGEAPVVFEHDCREGICGSCSLMINGHAHGPRARTTACQLHMREFKDGASIHIEPWRAIGFPLVKDLVVDRSSFDRIIAAGGYISVNTGAAPEANAVPIPRQVAEEAFDAASCIGCGACVAACPNGSAMLFVGAKVSHLARLPQGQAERYSRVRKMIQQMEAEAFGGCTNHGECAESCPKGIGLENIAQLNRDNLVAVLTGK
jgi:succinate dehydrogenase / fumarate reductase iron-sulfur subunit